MPGLDWWREEEQKRQFEIYKVFHPDKSKEEEVPKESDEQKK